MKLPTTALEVVYPKSRVVTRLVELEEDGIKHYGKSIPYEVWYETSIDLRELARLAERAVNNKGWKAKDGPVHVRVLARRALEGGEGKKCGQT